MTKAVFFDDIQIEIDDRAAQMGGSWQSKTATGQPMAYDPELVKFFYNKIRQIECPVIVDVGASTGSFSLLPILHDCQVLAFEPNPAAYDVLRSNIVLNNLSDRVIAHCVALSEQAGTGTLKIANADSHAALSTLGTSRYTDVGWSGHEVQTRTLDSYNLDRVDFLKVDVEGAELMVLRGAEDTIRRCKPRILLEYQALNTRQCGYEPREIMLLLREWGYTRFQHVGLEDLWATREPAREQVGSIALCTPICGPPKWGYFDSVVKWQAFHYDQHPDVPVTIIRPQRSAPAAMARNTLVERFLQTNCDYMWLVDDDATFLPGTLDRLMSWDVDIVGALCMMRKKACVLPSAFRGKADDGSDAYRVATQDIFRFIGEHYDYESNRPQILDPAPADSLYPVDFTGCHCLLVKREVMETMEPPWFAGRLGLEDRHFCLSAAAHGFGVYVDLSVLAGHTTERCLGAFDFMAGYWFTSQLEEKRNAERKAKGNGSDAKTRTKVLQSAEGLGAD